MAHVSYGFLVYALEFIEKEENEGKFHYLSDGKEKMKPKWSKLTDQERDRYKRKAQNMGERKIDEKIKLKQEQDKLIRDMEKYRGAIIRDKTQEYLTFVFECKDWRKEKFNIVHVNYYVQYNDEYYPAEIALLKFSLQNGVEEYFHTFITSENLPTGLRSDALLHAEGSHQIPLSYRKGICLATANSKIENFLQPNNQDYFFCFNDDYDKKQINNVAAAASALKLITSQNVIAIPLENLLHKFYKNIYGDQSFSIFDANKMLRDVPLEPKIGDCCAYHEEIDLTRYCSLANTRCWTMKIKKLLSEKENIKEIFNQSESWKYESNESLHNMVSDSVISPVSSKIEVEYTSFEFDE